MSALSRLLPLALGLAVLGPPLRAAPLDLAFLPPQVGEQSLCGNGRAEEPPDLPGPGQGDLTNEERIRFLQRDIRRYQSEAPNRHFDFLTALRKRLSSADESLAGIPELLDLIGLHIDAGRLADLETAGLVQQLAEARETLNNGQRMQLAQFYLHGIGLPRDEAMAHQLILEAGFGGHADALLFIARRMGEDRPLPGWDAPADLTATLAFGGLLGQMDSGVCARAERIAEHYRTGGIVQPNPQIAYAWLKFAADLGSASAAWRVVEFHLGAEAPEQDNAVMLHYLRRAVDRGIVLDDSAKGRLGEGGVDVDTLREILAFNQAEDRGRRRPTLTPLLQLGVNIDSQETSEGGPYLTYLREIAAIPSAPGAVFTEIARELAVRLGRWAGEDEIIAALETAVARDDAEAMRLLAARHIRYRDDPARLDRAVDLLTRAATRHRDAAAMDALDALFRCQAPDAPLVAQAEPWARAYRATDHRSVPISATSLLALDPFKDPWTLARLQAQALQGRTSSLANFLQLVQVDPMAPATRQRLWAGRADNSDKTLEEFAKLEFELATNPAERALALEFFRRVYLNNGVTTALDLAVAMVNDSGTDPAMAKEIRRLLRQAGQRGEGAAIRLLARLEQAEARVFAEFAPIIEARGDFLALMFALPHVAAEKRDDYFDRAVSEMNCSTKDTDELGEAHALHGNGAMSYHWRRIGLVIAGGNVLAKLRLTDGQITDFDTRAAPDAPGVLTRDRGDDPAARWRLFDLTGSPDLASHDPLAAAAHFKALVESGDNLPRAFDRYLAAPQALREAIDDALDFEALVARAAAAGDADALWRHARLLLTRAATSDALSRATEATRAAAEAGAIAAMAEYGRALALGTGVSRDETEALEWLDKAATAGDEAAASLARRLRLR
ncbi:MAG: sel1 repeat family protein [Rhodobacteraceae bacterium]|nr:MAG: sel1 repeat family protein [Paracoccaceae bacterium]